MSETKMICLRCPYWCMPIDEFVVGSECFYEYFLDDPDAIMPPCLVDDEGSRLPSGA